LEPEKLPRITYRFDQFTLDLARGALLAPEGAELPLRPKSFALLQLLVENAGRLLDRDAIMNAVWPGLTVTDDSITQCIRDIRRAFGDQAQGMLRTVQRRGYLFTATVSRVDSMAPLVRSREDLKGARTSRRSSGGRQQRGRFAGAGTDPVRPEPATTTRS
jgi:DNA-binding winged helix-turn-helix (wHTH) protein